MRSWSVGLHTTTRRMGQESCDGCIRVARGSQSAYPLTDPQVTTAPVRAKSSYLQRPRRQEVVQHDPRCAIDTESLVDDAATETNDDPAVVLTRTVFHS